MKKKISNFLAILVMMLIIAACVSGFAQKSYASEVKSSQDNVSSEAKEDDGAEQIAETTIGGVTYQILNEKNKIAKVTDSIKTIETATIKPTVKINGESYKVTIIMSKAFANRKLLKKVVIGKNIKGISKQVFWKDAKLKSVVFKGKNLLLIGKNTFKGTNKKVVIKVPKKCFKKYKKILQKTGLPKKAKVVKY